MKGGSTFTGEGIARSIGHAPHLWAWDCLHGHIQEAGSTNAFAMLDVLPEWPAHYHGRLAFAATVVAGIARRSGGWERLDHRLQGLVGADDARWQQIRVEQLTAFIAGALAVLGIGVAEMQAAKLLENVVRELPRLAWREPVVLADPRVSWLRTRLQVQPSVAVSSSDLKAAWCHYAIRTQLPQFSDGAESTRLGRAMRDAFMDEIRRGVIIQSTHITHTQAGEIARCRGWVGLMFADWNTRMR